MAGGVYIVLDRVGLFQLLRSPSGAVARDAKERGRRVQELARVLAPKRTGRLAESITVRMVPRLTGIAVQVGTGVDYAKFQHDGTGVHGPRHVPIRARRGKVMVFQVNGHTVFAKSVSGAPATKFLEHALRAAT